MREKKTQWKKAMDGFTQPHRFVKLASHSHTHCPPLDPCGDSEVSLLILEMRKTDAERVSDLFKVTQLGSGRTGIRIWVFWL